MAIGTEPWQPAAASKAQRQRRTRYIIYLFVFGGILWLLNRTLFTPSRTRIQYKKFKGKQLHLAQLDRQKAVHSEFSHAWYGYRDHAWKADTLKPLHGGGNNKHCGWAATIVDSLDTLWMMDMKDQFDEAVNATVAIDFRRSAASCQINLVDSTTRWLGGLMAAYDVSQDQRLLPKIVELGNLLHGQFNTKNGVPCATCNILAPGSRDRQPERNVPLSDIGSYYLEFSRLAQITGDKKYSDLTNHLTSILESHQDGSSIPGLWPERVDATSIDNGPTDKFSTAFHTYSLGALSDSAYEYLVKTHLLVGSQTKRYAQMWFKASVAIVHNLLFRAYIPQPQTQRRTLFTGIASHYDEKGEYLLEPRLQHLACFAGGIYAMSSRIFNNPLDLELGKDLTQGCIWAYENSPSGIMPETLTVMACPEHMGLQCDWNQTYWEQAEPTKGFPPGFLLSKNPRYLLRGEAAESLFVLYRVTGDEYYRDVGWEMFQSIIAHTRTPYGHAGISNVMRVGKQQGVQVQAAKLMDKSVQVDEMDSVWMGETLKYFWLLFGEPGSMSLDEWVFNTQGHPFRLTKGIRAP